MSILSQLKGNIGSTHKRKRIGRGDGSGHGGTSTKGHKGQKARSGGKIRRGFEGGQMPIMRRLPKFGFTNAKFRTPCSVVSLNQLEKFVGEVTPQILFEAGVVDCLNIKVLATGKISKAITVKAQKFSKQAKVAIEAAGGTVEVIK